MVRTNKRVRFFFLRSPFSLCFFVIFFAFASFERTRDSAFDSSQQNLDRLRTVASYNSLRLRPIVRSHRGRFVSLSVRRIVSVVFSVSLSQCLQRSLRNARIFRRLIVRNWRNVRARSMSRYCPLFFEKFCVISKSLRFFSLLPLPLNDFPSYELRNFYVLIKRRRRLGHKRCGGSWRT